MRRLLFVFNPAAGKGIIVGKLQLIINSYFKWGYLVTVLPTAQKDALLEALDFIKEYDRIVCAGGM